MESHPHVLGTSLLSRTESDRGSPLVRRGRDGIGTVSVSVHFGGRKDSSFTRLHRNGPRGRGKECPKVGVSVPADPPSESLFGRRSPEGHRGLGYVRVVEVVGSGGLVGAFEFPVRHSTNQNPPAPSPRPGTTRGLFGKDGAHRPPARTESPAPPCTSGPVGEGPTDPRQDGRPPSSWKRLRTGIPATETKRCFRGVISRGPETDLTGVPRPLPLTTGPSGRALGPATGSRTGTLLLDKKGSSRRAEGLRPLSRRKARALPGPPGSSGREETRVRGSRSSGVLR